MRVIRIAVGLVEATSHKAEDTANDVMRCIGNRYGVHRGSLLGAGVDTTTSALATSRALTASEYEDRCVMHVASLVFGHAAGLRERTVNKKVVDEFTVCMRLLKKAVALARYINDNYKKHAAVNGNKVLKLVVPGDTRIFGHLICIESLLCSMHVINKTFFQPKTDLNRAKNLTADEWTTIAEIHSVCAELQHFGMGSQADAVAGC